MGQGTAAGSVASWVCYQAAEHGVAVRSGGQSGTLTGRRFTSYLRRPSSATSTASFRSCRHVPRPTFTPCTSPSLRTARPTFALRSSHSLRAAHPAAHRPGERRRIAGAAGCARACATACRPHRRLSRAGPDQEHPLCQPPLGGLQTARHQGNVPSSWPCSHFLFAASTSGFSLTPPPLPPCNTLLTGRAAEAVAGAPAGAPEHPVRLV